MTKTTFEITFTSRDAAMAFVYVADGLEGDWRFAPAEVAAAGALAELVDAGQQAEGPFTVAVPAALRGIAKAVLADCLDTLASTPEGWRLQKSDVVIR